MEAMMATICIVTMVTEVAIMEAYMVLSTDIKVVLEKARHHKSFEINFILRYPKLTILVSALFFIDMPVQNMVIKAWFMVW